MPILHVNGVQLHYHVRGRGTPILFLHPPCLGSRVFTYMATDLARDHRTVTFDFRGHGRSDSSRARITIPLLAEDARRLLDALDIESAYLCAYGVGSLAALEALSAHPDRFLGAALLSGMPEAGGRARMRLMAVLWAIRLRAKEGVTLPTAWRHSDNRESWGRLRDELSAGDPVKWREYIESALAYTAVGRLPNIRRPALLLAGERDADGLRQLKRLQRGLKMASAAIVPGAGEALPVGSAGEAGDHVRAWIAAQAVGGADVREEAPFDEAEWVIGGAGASERPDDAELRP